MYYNYLNIIGLMTGTSMDGIDICLVKTNGINLIRENKNYFYKYNNTTKDFLLNILKEDINVNLSRKKLLDQVITNEHFKAIKSFKIIEKSDLIGFHGQTIYHNPIKKCSIQLGDPIKLATMSNKKVIFDFRTNDIKMGGQGAPLAPIYHKFIINDLNLELPTCIINIGGVSNITMWDGKKLIGFDTGPGNALMDNYMKKNFNKYYDKNGFKASKGIAKKELITKYLKHGFFKKEPPKSLDRNSFINFYNEILKKNYSAEDTMATLCEFTIETIILAFDFLPKNIKNVLITGGGYKNKYLIKSLEKRLNINFIKEENTNIKFDYLEAELIAYLSARSYYRLPYTFPSTTGISITSTGGKIYSPL